MRAFGFHHAGVNGIHANLARAQFVGQTARGRVDGGFGAAVDRRIGKWHGGGYRTDVDHCTAVGTEMFGGLLRGEQQTEHVQVELLVKMFRGDFTERGEFINAGVVHQNIDLAERLFRFLEEPLDVGLFGDIGLHGDGLASFLFDLTDDAVRAGFAGGIIHDDRRASRREF